MSAEVLALLCALCFATGHVVTKLAVRQDNVLAGLVVSLVTGSVAVGAVSTFLVDDWAIPPLPLALFVLAGLTGPGLGRVLAIRAVRDAGTSVAIPVQASANPLLSSLAGVTIFGEIMDAGRVLALGLIILGIVACARGGSANRDEQVPLTESDRPTLQRLALLSWPLAAGAAYAGADVLRKAALVRFDAPILGTLIAMVASLIVWAAVLAVRPDDRRGLKADRAMAWFGVHGVVSAAAVAFLLLALSIGDLSVVAPIVASQPVIVIVLGALLLRRFERLRPGTVLGSVAVFTAVAYLALR